MLYRYGPAYVYSIRYSLPTLSTLYKLVIPSPARYIIKGGIIINMITILCLHTYPILTV